MFGLFKESKVNSISANELDGKLGKISIIDIREPFEFKAGHIPTAKNIPMNLILKDTSEYIDKAKEYHIVCQSGGRSSRVCMALASRGYNVVNISGGTRSYISPLEK